MPRDERIALIVWAALCLALALPQVYKTLATAARYPWTSAHWVYRSPCP